MLSVTYYKLKILGKTLLLHQSLLLMFTKIVLKQIDVI